MNRITAIIIGLSIFGSVLGGAYVDNGLAAKPERVHMPESISIVPPHKPVIQRQASMALPDPVSHKKISYDLRGRKLVAMRRLVQTASIAAASKAIRECKR